MAPDVVEASQDSAPGDRFAGSHLSLERDAKRGEYGGQAGDHGGRIHHRRPTRKGVQKAANRWPQDGGRLKDAGIPGHRIGEMLFRNQLRQKRPAHRTIERAHHADQHNHCINQPDGVAALPGDRPQQSRRHGEAAIAQGEHFAPVEAVGNVSRDQEQQHAR